MQGFYTYIPETNNVPKEYNVAAILSLLFMVPIYYYYYYYYYHRHHRNHYHPILAIGNVVKEDM
jgi:hypothetical protein